MWWVSTPHDIFLGMRMLWCFGYVAVVNFWERPKRRLSRIVCVSNATTRWTCLEDFTRTNNDTIIHNGYLRLRFLPWGKLRCFRIHHHDTNPRRWSHRRRGNCPGIDTGPETRDFNLHLRRSSRYFHLVRSHLQPIRYVVPIRYYSFSLQVADVGTI